ncbi:hypothetical protein [Photobacterium alginatilyticum]|uniref:Chemotaxis methyl-accepting receptor HlyB-like 4HB MCP domain-containing protein n=1 Tax=Photobacterium alginatilyticum TaxID=1775171 RepID=A0ABW9YRU9_9GAMM|nr:hypothetical protein [Photobacterium alginatilyticum]NBI56282.1 hypothetical protein [Photobacterium alginatilyticum]
MDKSAIKVSFIAGLFALSGSGITGIFMLKANEATIGKEVAIHSANIANQYHSELKEKSEIFIVAVYDFFSSLNENPDASSAEVRAMTLALQKKAMSLSIYASPTLTSSSLEVVKALSDMPKLTSQGGGKEKADRVVKALENWRLAYRKETSSYSNQIVSDSLASELLTQAFQ